jgi:hypothetical protein
MCPPRLLPTLLCGLLAGAPLLHAGQVCNLRLLGSNRLGPAHVSVASGTTVYLVAGSRLEVLDVSDPAAPALRGWLDLDFHVEELRLDGTLLAATGGTAGLVLFDVSDSEHPTETGRVPTEQSAMGLALLPGLALVAVHGDFAPRGLLLFDISDPSNPMQVGDVDMPPEGAQDVAAVGHLAFVFSFAGLQIFDVSDPSQPLEVTTLEVAGWDPVVSPDGNRLYFLDAPTPPLDGGYLDVVDVSNPVAPFLVGRFGSYPDPFQGLTLEGDYLYTVDPIYGLAVFDTASAIGMPRFVGGLSELIRAEHLAAGGPLLFVAQGNEGLDLVDVSNPSTPYQIGRITAQAESYGVAVQGLHAYVRADGFLRILDVSDPALPADVGAFGTYDHDGLRPSEALVQNDVAFVPDSSGLRVLNVGDPAHPFEIGSWPAWRAGVSVARSGDVLYLGLNSWFVDPALALVTLDVTDPANPIELSASEDDGWWAQRLVLSGNMLFGDQRGDCRTFDLSDPVHPAQVGACDLGLQVDDLAVRGGLGYLAGREFSVADFSQPEAPTLLGSLPYEYPGYQRLALAGHRVFLAHREGGIVVADVAVPTAPAVIGRVKTPGSAVGIAWNGGQIYVADSDAGISIFEDCSVFEDGFESGDLSAWSVVP